MVSPRASLPGPATGDTQCWQLSALPGLSSYRPLAQTTSPRDLNAVERNCGLLCSEVSLSSQHAQDIPHQTGAGGAASAPGRAEQNQARARPLV